MLVGVATGWSSGPNVFRRGSTSSGHLSIAAPIRGGPFQGDYLRSHTDAGFDLAAGATAAGGSGHIRNSPSLGGAGPAGAQNIKIGLFGDLLCLFWMSGELRTQFKFAKRQNLATWDSRPQNSIRRAKMRLIIRKLARDTQGSNALEYGLIVGLISLAIVAGATAAGGALNTVFTAVGGQITTVTSTITT